MDILSKVLRKHYTGKWGSFPAPTGTMADFENINWIDDAPNKSDFQKQYDAEEQAYKNTQYQRDRAVAYPSIQDQLDMQYHDQVNGTTTWKDSIAKVKADNPKP